MPILSAYPILSLIVVLFATMFVFGEVLVKGKGLLAATGLALILFYFYTFLDPSMVLIVGLVYGLGLILIFVDGEFINDGLLGSIGLILMIGSLAFASPNLSTGLYAFLGLLVGAGLSVLWLKILPRRALWSKVILSDRLDETSGYNSVNPTYGTFVGRTVKTTTDLRPVGRILVDDKEYSAISNGQFIARDEKVKITSVDGTKILVEKIHEHV